MRSFVVRVFSQRPSAAQRYETRGALPLFPSWRARCTHSRSVGAEGRRGRALGATASPGPGPVEVGASAAVETDVAVVGGGPAGALLAYLFARAGIQVHLFEGHSNFDRHFRGDTLHPSSMEIFDDLSLAEDVLGLAGSKMERMVMSLEGSVNSEGSSDFTIVSLDVLDTKFPFIAMVPQTSVLELLVAKAGAFPEFQLHLGTRVTELIEDQEGAVRGVRARRSDGSIVECRATLTVGADGRKSKLRELMGVKSVGASPPMDVLWFRVPKMPNENPTFGSHFKGGQILVKLDRGDSWQVGYVVTKGRYGELRQEGLDHFKELLVAVDPSLADRVHLISDWKDINFLQVEAGMCDHWCREGALLIGDAAHIMSPVGGIGIAYALSDAVATANLLSSPLKEGHLKLENLQAVQRRREFPTRVAQAFQGIMQKSLIQAGLEPDKPFHPPLALRLPPVRWLLAHMVGFGVRRERVELQQ